MLYNVTLVFALQQIESVYGYIYPQIPSLLRLPPTLPSSLYLIGSSLTACRHLPKHHLLFLKKGIPLFLLFIYLFLAALGLRFCARAFSSCGKRGPLFIAVCGPLTIAASLVAEHKLQTRRLSSCGSPA